MGLTRLPAWAQFLLLWALASGVMLALSACQRNEYHVSDHSRIVLDNGSGTQERGRNSPDVLNEPDVSVIP